jgi:acetoin utilization deacetylase AcuC-like enzyme
MGSTGSSMLPFKLVYSDRYYLPIGEHVFPAEKYRHIHERLLMSHVAEPADFLEPKPAEDRDILRVHTSEYVYKLQNGTLSAKEELLMEIPYSYELVDAFWLAAGGSILAAECALQDGVGINIGGGFHHAFPNHGEGFCMIHDVAVAIRRMQKDNKIKRAMTIDCDVHQGNGTAFIFAPHRTAPEQMASRTEVSIASLGTLSTREVPADDVFTISLHQANNYPHWKPPSAIDVNLPDHCKDEDYLSWLDKALTSGLNQFQPDLLCFIAGADPYREDQLGGLDLTIQGLKQRDEYVFRTARERNIPVMVTYAGGYARNTEDTVTIHANTVVAAKEIYSAS